MYVCSKSLLAAKDLSDCTKRQSPASSMKRSIAHGPASECTFGWSSSPSFQKHNADRNEKSRFVRYLKTTGSAGACGCAHESTVLVVPKSSPSARGAESCESGMRRDPARRDQRGAVSEP